jgi:hypothetical protein
MLNNNHSNADMRKSKKRALILIFLGTCGIVLTLTLYLIGGSFADFFFNVTFLPERGSGALGGPLIVIIPSSLVFLGLGIYQLLNINKKIL